MMVEDGADRLLRKANVNASPAGAECQQLLCPNVKIRMKLYFLVDPVERHSMHASLQSTRAAVHVQLRQVDQHSLASRGHVNHQHTMCFRKV